MSSLGWALIQSLTGVLKKKENLGTETYMHTETVPCEDCSFAPIAEELPEAGRELGQPGSDP